MNNSAVKTYSLHFGISLLALTLVGPISFSVISIPFTLQTFVLCLIAYWFKWPALLATIIYITSGLLGLPVFSGFASNPKILTTTSAGFVLAFPIMVVFVIGFKSMTRNRMLQTILLFIIVHIALLASAFVINTLLNNDFLSLNKVTTYLLPSLIVKSFLAGLVVKLSSVKSSTFKS